MGKVIHVVYILFIIFELAMWHYQKKFDTNIVKFHASVIDDNFKNQLIYKGIIFELYGFEGKRLVNSAYEVYVPIYMARSTRERIENENQTSNN